MGPCAARDEFYTQNLFTAHMERMHGPPYSASYAEKEAFAERIVVLAPQRIYRKRPPVNTICPYCPEHPSFESWDDRMDHIGLHLEKQDMDFDSETEDAALVNWLVAQGFIDARRPFKFKGSVMDEEEEDDEGFVDGVDGRESFECTVKVPSTLEAYMRRELEDNQSTLDVNCYWRPRSCICSILRRIP